MSLVNNDLWHVKDRLAHRYLDERLDETSNLNGVIRRQLGWVPKGFHRISMKLKANTLRVRMLAASVACPAIAYGALAMVSDLAEPQSAVYISALSMLAGLLLARGAISEALKPLSDLAYAANRLDITGKTPKLSERRDQEASVAARAFNEMSERVSRQFEERIQLLSAFSHDVQTPITRMRLRVELADHFPDREKILRDLHEAEKLVRDGIAYAKSSHLTNEAAVSVDVRSFVETIALDYQDTGRQVSFQTTIDRSKVIKPAALRRVLSNFIDNALKFAGSADIKLSENAGGDIVITVMDRGPGIAADKLEVAVKPFVRLEQSSSDRVPGVGLGLAIAQQLAESMNARVLLRNRTGGGLAASVILDR